MDYLRGHENGWLVVHLIRSVIFPLILLNGFPAETDSQFGELRDCFIMPLTTDVPRCRTEASTGIHQFEAFVASA